MSKNIIILAAGPAKDNRVRHLEKTYGSNIFTKIYNLIFGKRLIDISIDISNNLGIKPYVVVDKSNHRLISYLRNKKLKKILYPQNQKIFSTLKVALDVKGDSIIICGDIHNLNDRDIKSFINSKYKSASAKYKDRWGEDILSSDKIFLRRADVGDSIQLISESHKKEFLSSKNYNKAVNFFYSFYPRGNNHKEINEYHYNDIGTFLSYSFYFEIWSNPLLDSYGDKGLIKVVNTYLDNE